MVSQFKATPEGQLPTTKEQAAKAARAPKVKAKAEAPPLDTAPATLKEQDAAQSDAPAPPPVIPADMAAQTPNAGLPPREQAIERDARYWEYLRTTSPDDIEARAQQAAKLDEATKQLAQPKAKDEHDC